MTTRNYSYKNVDMLLASQTISQSFQNHLDELSFVRTTWTEAYATELVERINNTIDHYLGRDKQQELRRATLFLSNIQKPAIKSLSFLKTQIEVDFNDSAKEIIKTLGFNKNWKSARKGDQEALIEMLHAFKKGMTSELQSSIIEKGTNPTLIENIISYATQLDQANITQETLKQTSQELTEEGQLAFNSIYTEVIGICKIAAQFYDDEPLKKEQFTFSKIVKQMGGTPKSKSPNTDSVMPS